MTQLTCGWSCVILGTLLVGVGGSLATLGWNKIADYERWRNTIVGVVREVALNDHMIRTATDLANDWPARANKENFSYESYHNSHILALVTSGGLDPNVPNDRELLDALDTYQHAVARFNAALRVVGRQNPGLFIKTNLIEVTDAKLWPKNTRDALAQPFLTLVEGHEAAKGCLQRR